MHLDRLIFEVTRRCNMSCGHCLRGDAQDKDITEEVIDATLKDVEHINSITFTGGEPLLNVPAIKYIFKRIHEKNIEYGYWWMATNGKIYDQELINLLIEEYADCIERDEDFYGGLALSINDGYHEDIDRRNIIRYQALKFYDDSKEGEYNKINQLIKEGRAYKIGIREPNNTGIEIEINSNIEVDGDVYINVNGDVLTECDYSYETQDYVNLGNVLDTPLKDILIESYGGENEQSSCECE